MELSITVDIEMKKKKVAHKEECSNGELEWPLRLRSRVEPATATSMPRRRRYRNCSGRFAERDRESRSDRRAPVATSRCRSTRTTRTSI